MTNNKPNDVRVSRELKCWSCKAVFTLSDHADCDGCCWKCGVEIDIPAAPQPPALVDDLESGMDLGMFLAEMKNVKAERDQLKAEAEQLSETSMSQEAMIEQLMALCDEQAKALHTLISVARTVNRNDASEIRVPGDDEPQYRQRKEWIEYLLETCAEAEALSKPVGSEQ